MNLICLVLVAFEFIVVFVKGSSVAGLTFGLSLSAAQNMQETETAKIDRAFFENRKLQKKKITVRT